MSAWHTLQRHWQRRRLKEARFAPLFDASPEHEAVSLDLETTGLDPKRDEIIAIAAVRVVNRRVLAGERLELSVCPQTPIPAASIRIHQLRQQDVADGLAVQDALALLLDFIGPRPLIGYNLAFDMAVINRHLQPWLGVRLTNVQIDVAHLYRKRMDRSPYHSEIDLGFEAICRELALPHLARHNAFNDALLTALAYLKLRDGKP
ncbi:3'-5' exonuclease [Chitinibacteraceae bacterium HSL-7]